MSEEQAGPQTTGHPAVDEVLRSLRALDEAPVDEHAAVFESAHEQLRHALSNAHEGVPTDEQA